MKMSTAGPLRTQVVECIATHYEPHPDEAMAIWMAARFGRETFLGIQRALREGRVLFCDAGRDMPTHLPCKRERILEVGVGGREFDEHRDGQTGNECAATLMADRLGRGDTALERMVQWTLANDQDAEGTAFDWSDIMKAGFHAGASNMVMLKRSFRVFDAVYNTLSGTAKYRDITGMRGYWQLAVDWVLGLTKNDLLSNPKYLFSGPIHAAQAIGLAGDESISWILNYETDVFGLDGKPPRVPGFMEIPNIVDALFHDGASIGEVTYFVREMLNARLAEQRLFLKAVDQWASIMAAKHGTHPDGGTFTVEESGVTYRVAVVVSDNRRIVSAVRAHGPRRPHVIVRVLPRTGHISLFANGLDVTPIVARLRAACWEVMGNTSPLPPEKLAHEWTITEVPQLCHQKKAGNILNGSLTAPHVDAVRLSLKTYITIMKAGLREVARAAAQHRRDAKRRSEKRRDERRSQEVQLQ
ncbi:MAG TPA: hypothetical protein VMU12_01010 [Candidatus Paceibacterota bacterium]|nr:hypothetical protein [Candidatus Paceibacterota bacterium]